MFQSTFPRGERLSFQLICAIYKCFNPRSHEGNDAGILSSETGYKSFNPRSHEGNDCLISSHIIDGTGFNPRSHEGTDFDLGEQIEEEKRFQSTFPRGERRMPMVNARKNKVSFNPRSHEGNDDQLSAVGDKITVSIHVPTRGTTLCHLT